MNEDIIVTTIDSVPARQIEMVLGIVSYEDVRVVNEPSTFKDSLFELKKQAHHINANAIIGYSASTACESDMGCAVHTLHIGTAVRLKEE